MPRPLGLSALSDNARLASVCLTSVCLSLAYIGPKSKTERPRDTKIGTEVAHVTRDSGTTFQCCFQDLFRSRLQVSRPRPRPGPSSLETETWAIRSRDQDRDRDLDRMNSGALESRDHGLEITTLAASILDIGDRALA